MSEDSQQVENMIASLEDSKRQAEKEVQEANEVLKNAELLQQDLQKKMIEYYDTKDALQEKAADEARDIVEKAKREADGIIHDLRKMRIEKHAEVKEHELIDAQKKLNEAAPKEKKSKKPELKAI